MTKCCENCGWSETIGSPIMCNYSGHRTFRDEVCPAWKPKDGEGMKKDFIVRRSITMIDGKPHVETSS